MQAKIRFMPLLFLVGGVGGGVAIAQSVDAWEAEGSWLKAQHGKSMRGALGREGKAPEQHQGTPKQGPKPTITHMAPTNKLATHPGVHLAPTSPA